MSSRPGFPPTWVSTPCLNLFSDDSVISGYRHHFNFKTTKEENEVLYLRMTRKANFIPPA